MSMPSRSATPGIGPRSGNYFWRPNDEWKKRSEFSPLPCGGVSRTTTLPAGATSLKCSHDEGQKAPGGSATPLLTRVYLLIESRLLREALARIFRRFSDFQVVGQSGQTESVHQGIRESMCDLVVMDHFDQSWFAQFFRTQGCQHPDPKTLLIGMDSDADLFLAAVRSGVTGYLLNDASAMDIVSAARALVRGEACCPPQYCWRLFQYVAQQYPTGCPAEVMPARPNITLRQQRLVDLVAKGLTNKEIASQLQLSEFTVKNHLHRIMRRLKTTNRGEVVDVIRAHEREVLQTKTRGSESLA